VFFKRDQEARKVALATRRFGPWPKERLGEGAVET